MGSLCCKRVEGVANGSRVFKMGPAYSKWVQHIQNGSSIFKTGPACSKRVQHVQDGFSMFKTGQAGSKQAHRIEMGPASSKWVPHVQNGFSIFKTGQAVHICAYLTWLMWMWAGGKMVISAKSASCQKQWITINGKSPVANRLQPVTFCHGSGGNRF
ncbi:hypothetical protein BU15DRAFT_68713 [Melanogaster broomeanus]|nr:hypothetical protein BU15DRAFT_68713 [Melanogaster broomeanus]